METGAPRGSNLNSLLMPAGAQLLDIFTRSSTTSCSLLAKAERKTHQNPARTIRTYFLTSSCIRRAGLESQFTFLHQQLPCSSSFYRLGFPSGHKKPPPFSTLRPLPLLLFHRRLPPTLTFLPFGLPTHSYIFLFHFPTQGLFHFSPSDFLPSDFLPSDFLPSNFFPSNFFPSNNLFLFNNLFFLRFFFFGWKGCSAAFAPTHRGRLDSSLP
jgi:hypothetical protein